MKERKLTKVEMARRMHTSRVQLDRLLDPDNYSVTLATLRRAAAMSIAQEGHIAEGAQEQARRSAQGIAGGTS
jgi:hypothetical protein